MTETRRCPICRQPILQPRAAFCSLRCQQVDLARWLSEGYAIPTAEPPDPPAEERD
jgi:endogenous inhibitor of DNA gyrase (YacG/DUF329 family)